MKHRTVIAFLLCSLLGLLFCGYDANAQNWHSSIYHPQLNRGTINWQIEGVDALTTLGSINYSIPSFAPASAVDGWIVYFPNTNWRSARIYDQAGNLLEDYTITTAEYEIDLEPDQYLILSEGMPFQYYIEIPFTPTPTPITETTPETILTLPTIIPDQTPLDILPIYSASITTTASGSGLSILALLFLFLSFRLIYWVTHR